ncbi:hypothetical protein ABTE17_20545, partial [Acinetobacter baumannii]
YTPAGQTQSYEVICTPQAQGVAVSLGAGRREAQQLQQQRTDRKLHESETRVRLMTGAIPQIVWITNDAGVLEFINDQWHQYTGEALH